MTAESARIAISGARRGIQILAIALAVAMGGVAVW